MRQLALIILSIFPTLAQSAADYPGNPDSSLNLPPPTFQKPVGELLHLPDITSPPQEETGLSARLRIYVSAYRFTGNTAVSSSELENLARAYTGRTVTAEDLQALRHKISLLYANKGYINSGALLPDQKITDNIVTFKIVEGTLNRINVTGTKKMAPDYVQNRLMLGATPPLNVNSLQQRLVMLQQNGLFERINAQLQPGMASGESSLDVVVKEATPYQLGMTFSNHYSPSIGANHLEIYASNKNMSGRGDRIDIAYGRGIFQANGLSDYSLRYSSPINAKDLTIGFHISQNNSTVIEAPFNDLNITSRSKTVGVDLYAPVIDSPNEKLTLGLVLERRQSQTYLFNLPFSFSPGTVGGESSESVGRFSQEWVKKELLSAVTLRSTLSVGSTNALPKVNAIGPDRHFLSWLGQWQRAQKLDADRQLILLGNLQWTSQTLLSMEQLGLGGANTVRGYRETQLLRDKGGVFSAEYRMPIFFDQAGTSRTQLAYFTDYGQGSNTDATIDTPRSISSIGLGILWNPDKHWHAETYIGHSFRKFAVHGSQNLQDNGIHFLLNYLLN